MWGSPGQHRTTPRGTASVRDLIARYWACWKLYALNREVLEEVPGAIDACIQRDKERLHRIFPFFLMFGRHPRLPIDIVMGTREANQEKRSYPEFVASLRERLDYAYSVVAARVSRAQEHQRKNYDLKQRGAAVELGEIVLVRNVNLRGKTKLAD